MAGISIILVSFLIIIILISTFIALGFLTASMILFIQKRKLNNEAKIRTKKTAAIITLIAGIIFLLPLLITILGTSINAGLQKAKDRKMIESFENKVIVAKDEWINGFEYNGGKLVPVNIFLNSDNYRNHGQFKNLDKIGVVVIKNTNNYYSLYEVDNDSGFKIYYVWVESFTDGRYYSRTFVNQNDYDAILSYYDTVHYEMSALWKSAPEGTHLNNKWQKLDLDIDDRRDELIELAHAVLDDISDKKTVMTSLKDYDSAMELAIMSPDKVLSVDLVLYTKNNEIILYLEGYKVEDNVVQEYEDMLYSLMKDVQDELCE